MNFFFFFFLHQTNIQKGLYISSYAIISALHGWICCFPKSAYEASSRWPIISHSSTCNEHDSSEMMCNTGVPSLWQPRHGTQTLIAMSITVREEQNAITSREKSEKCLWRETMKHEKKIIIIEANAPGEALYRTSAILITPTAKVL